VQFAANLKEVEALGAEIVGVSMNSPNSHEKLKQENSLPLLSLSLSLSFTLSLSLSLRSKHNNNSS
jgi:peroxiredoxin